MFSTLSGGKPQSQANQNTSDQKQGGQLFTQKKGSQSCTDDRLGKEGEGCNAGF
jgi:hypothetical protein